MSADRGSLTFAVLIFLLCLFFVIISFNYEYNSRLIPVLVGFSTLVLALAVLIHEIQPVSILEKMNIDWTKDLRVTESVTEKKDGIPPQKYLVVLCWILGFFLLTFLFGFHISVALFTFVFLKIEGKVGWIKASLIAGISEAGIFVIFEWAMGFGLFEGILFGEIIPPI
jgi:hypothetical protein